MSGIELYDQLHGSKELAALPALVMSASLPRQELAKRHVVGIEKPFAFVLLLLAVLVGSSILYALSARYGQRIVLHFGKYLTDGFLSLGLRVKTGPRLTCVQALWT